MADDGTLWRAAFTSEDAQPEWKQLKTPPDGNGLREEPTLEEQAERLRKKGGRALLLGRGLKGKSND